MVLYKLGNIILHSDARLDERDKNVSLHFTNCSHGQSMWLLLACGGQGCLSLPPHPLPLMTARHCGQVYILGMLVWTRARVRRLLMSEHLWVGVKLDFKRDRRHQRLETDGCRRKTKGTFWLQRTRWCINGNNC